MPLVLPGRTQCRWLLAAQTLAPFFGAKIYPHTDVVIVSILAQVFRIPFGDYSYSSNIFIGLQQLHLGTK